jgi:hypothetical protein
MRILFPLEMKAENRLEASASADETAGITFSSAASYEIEELYRK